MTHYEPIIGLEVHVELSTRSKMFCTCSADYFGKEPNTHTCPVCLGLPGALPVANKTALENCIKIGLALGCTVSEESRFERKNYFYPDLAKGYQISQYRWPLSKGGVIKVKNKAGEVREIRVNRVHMEEDTAKLIHQFGVSNEEEKTLVDFNRSGVPLVEIVTEPDFRDTEEIRYFAKKLQQICRYLGVSTADMEKGDMRLEANVSVRKVGNTELPPYRVELKNINSFRFVVAAVEYEIQRQIEAQELGKRLVQETRGWDENKKQTYVQRVKEEANDYRYFSEPDIPIIRMKNKVSRIKQEMPELPLEKKKRFMDEYGLNEVQAVILTDTQEFADYFEETIRTVNSLGLSLTAQKIANTLINKKFNRDEILPAQFVEMLTKEQRRRVLPDDELEKAVCQAITDNPQAVADYKKGKETAVQFLIGQVMSKTRGLSDPAKAATLILSMLKEK